MNRYEKEQEARKGWAFVKVKDFTPNVHSLCVVEGLEETITLHRTQSRGVLIPRDLANYTGVRASVSFTQGRELRRLFPPITLRKEQTPAVHEVLDQLLERLGAVLQAPCGSGKTICALEIVRRLGRSTVVMVHKEFLADQWEERIKEFLPGATVGRIQQDRCDSGEDFDFVIAMVQSVSSRDYPAAVLNSFGLFITDECVTGDALIPTDKGIMPLREVVGGVAKKVLSFCVVSKTWAYREVLKAWCSGKKKVVMILTRQGMWLRLTQRHPVWTQRGWVFAKDLTPRDRLATPVNVVVDPGYLETSAEEKLVLCWGTRTREGCVSIGPCAQRKLMHKRLCAVVVVGKNYSLLRNGCGVAESKHIVGQNLRKGTIANATRGILQTHKRRALSVPCLGMGVYATRTTSLEVQDCSYHTVYNKNLGYCTRWILCLRQCPSLCEKLQTVVMGLGTFGWTHIQRVTQVCGTYTKNSTTEKINLYPCAYSVCSQIKVLHGGLWMMAPAPVAAVCVCTPRDSTELALLQWSLGSLTEVCRLRSIEMPECRKTDIFCLFLEKALTCLSDLSKDMLCQACCTNWISVVAVEWVQEPELVYDLTVKGVHNFVANGILVHNCHRTAAPTWGEAVTKFGAKYRLGLTATPQRVDGMHPVFFRHIGPIAHAITVRRVRPVIYPVALQNSYERKNYTNAWDGRQNSAKMLSMLANDVRRNEQILKFVLQAIEKGRKIILLSDRLSQVAWFISELSKIFAGTGKTAGRYVGGMKKSARDESAECDAIVATYAMAQEGLDITSLDTLFLLTPRVNIEQSVGRILREQEDKKSAIVVDFVDTKFRILNNYAGSRQKVYQRLHAEVKPMIAA